MPVLTKWKSVRRDGTVADTPGTCLQYKYAVDFWINWDPNAETTLLSIAFSSISGVSTPVTDMVSVAFPITLKLVFYTGTWGQGHVVHFEQETTWRYQLVALLYNVLGAIVVVSYTGWFLPDPIVRTTICGHTMALAKAARSITAGEDIIPITGIVGDWPTSGDAYIGTERVSYTGIADSALTGVHRGNYRAAAAHPVGTEVREAPSTIGAETADEDPASCYDWGGSETHVLTDLISPVYRLNLPSGAKARILFHTAGSAKLPSNLEGLFTRLCAGKFLAVRDPRQGLTWTATPGATGADVASHFDDGQAGPFTSKVSGAQSTAAFFRFPASTRLGLVRSGIVGAYYHESLSEGKAGTWTMSLLAKSIEPMAGCLSEDGGTIYWLGKRGSLLRMFRSRFRESATPGSTDEAEASALTTEEVGAPVGIASTADVRWMAQQQGALHALAQVGSNTVHYTSKDGGATWV